MAILYKNEMLRNVNKNDVRSIGDQCGQIKIRESFCFSLINPIYNFLTFRKIILVNSSSNLQEESKTKSITLKNNGFFKGTFDKSGNTLDPIWPVMNSVTHNLYFLLNQLISRIFSENF